MKTPVLAFRIALLALIIQFASPVFFSVIAAGMPVMDFDGNSTVHANHCSVIAPLLIKEKDESEVNLHQFFCSMVALIDFSNLSSALTAQHAIKITPLSFRSRLSPHPPLFTLYRTFLI